MTEWDSTAIEALKNLYIETDIPSDPLIKDKTALMNFTSVLNSRLSGANNFNEEEVASELFSLRKSGNLPRIRD